MSYDYLLQILKSLKDVGPEPGFSERSRRLILAAPQKPSYLFKIKDALVHSLKISFAIGLTAVMMLSLSGRFSPVPSFMLASLNNKKLVKEGLGANLNIQLAEARYYAEVNAQINLALKEIISNGQSH